MNENMEMIEAVFEELFELGITGYEILKLRNKYRKKTAEAQTLCSVCGTSFNPECPKCQDLLLDAQTMETEARISMEGY